jgi:hypothetical protein
MSFAPAFRVFSMPLFYLRGEALCLAATMIRYGELEE